MSRPSPLEHLPRLMAEADATIAQLRTQVHDQEVANEALRNQIDVMGRRALELQAEVDRGGPSKAWREGSLTTLPQGEIRVAAEQPVRIDGVLIRGRRSKAGHAHDVLNVELVDEDDARITVSFRKAADGETPAEDIQLEPVKLKAIEEPPGWLVNAQMRAIVDSISKTLRDEPAAEWLALPRRAAHIIVALASAPVVTGMRYTQAELEAAALRAVSTPMVLEADCTVPATAATMLLELVQTLRARLAHASTELRHRAEPAPEVDDVGAACAVLAEDLDGIVIEIDRVLEAVPR
jgi:hypothetical protein